VLTSLTTGSGRTSTIRNSALVSSIYRIRGRSMLSARLIDALVPRAGGWPACMSDESNDYYLGRTAEEWFVERVLIAAVVVFLRAAFGFVVVTMGSGKGMLRLWVVSRLRDSGNLGINGFFSILLRPVLPAPLRGLCGACMCLTNTISPSLVKPSNRVQGLQCGRSRLRSAYYVSRQFGRVNFPTYHPDTVPGLPAVGKRGRSCVCMLMLLFEGSCRQLRMRDVVVRGTSVGVVGVAWRGVQKRWCAGWSVGTWRWTCNG